MAPAMRIILLIGLIWLIVRHRPGKRKHNRPRGYDLLD